jgi:hypothetical protein
MQRPFCSSYCLKCERCRLAVDDLAKLDGVLKNIAENNARIRGPHIHEVNDEGAKRVCFHHKAILPPLP